MNKIAAGALLFFGCVVLVFSIVSIATPDWVIGPFSRFGLWELCIGQACSVLSYESVTWRMWFARIFMISGALTLLSVCVQIARVLFQSTDLSSFLVANGIPGGFMVSAIQTMIAMSVFTSGVTVGYGITWGYSFALGWVSFVSCIFLAVAAGVALRMGSSI